jgi:hypothetical protein
MLFGTIVQLFARYELLMQEIMATVIRSDSAAVILLTRGLGFADKRHALLDLLRHRRVPLDQCDAVYKYLEVPHTFSVLCDNIEHSTWMVGPSQNSIQPDWILGFPSTIKPIHKPADTRSEDFIEDDDDRVEYTLNGLAETVETLSKNYELFFDYVWKNDLIDRRIGKRQGDATNADIWHE